MRFLTTLAVLMVALVFGGCSEDDSFESMGKAEEGTPATLEASQEGEAPGKQSADKGKKSSVTKMDGVKAGPTPAALKVAVSDEDAIYFCVDKVGIVRLDDKGFKTFPKKRLEYCKSLMISPTDGRGYMVGWSLDKLTDKGRKTVASKALLGNKIHEVGALGPNGSKLAGGFSGLWFNNGTKWSSFDKVAIGYTGGSPKHVYIDANSHIWLATTYGFYHYDGKAWNRLFDTAKAKSKLFIEKFEVLADGRIILFMSGKIGVYDGKGLAVHEVGNFSVKNGFVGKDGMIYVVGHKTITGYDATDFSPQKAFALDEAGLRATWISHASMDNTGRFWAMTDGGVLILDKDFNPTLWPTSSVSAIAGKLKHLVAVGKGPSKLPTPGKVATGSIKGQFLKDGTPLGNVVAELCESPAFTFKASPCERKPFSKKTTTSSDGNFIFADVPLSSYGVAVKVAGKWHKTMFSNCAGLKEGQVCDLGKLSLKTKEK
jgi:hypothetical protein